MIIHISLVLAPLVVYGLAHLCDELAVHVSNNRVWKYLEFLSSMLFFPGLIAYTVFGEIAWGIVKVALRKRGTMIDNVGTQTFDPVKVTMDVLCNLCLGIVLMIFYSLYLHWGAVYAFLSFSTAYLLLVVYAMRRFLEWCTQFFSMWVLVVCCYILVVPSLVGQWLFGKVVFWVALNIFQVPIDDLIFPQDMFERNDVEAKRFVRIYRSLEVLHCILLGLLIDVLLSL